MRTLVTHENLEQVISRLLQVTGVVGFDTETYGLKWNDKMFSLQLCTENNESFYFNFHNYKDGSTPTLDREILNRLNPLFANSNIRWVAHNAKFDLRRLEIDGIRLNGEVYDTMSMAHIEYNKHMSYSLDNCLKRIGKEKNGKVELWIRDNKAYTTYLVEGKKTKEKDLHYDRVPFDIMFEYGLDDVELTLELYRHQTKFFEENPDQIPLVHNELQLIKAVYEMESTGIAVDVGYCNKMYVKELKTQREIVKHIEKLTDKEFKNGPKWLSSVLQEQGIELHTTEKGNASLGKKELSSMDNAIPQLILEMRDAEKRATAFYAPLQRMADKGIIHPSYRLTGTDTGRFSCSNPNIQQIPKQEKETGDTVRQAFIPRPGYFFLSIDYDQMEYRIMADYAGETNMISAIKSGLDPHTYVANMMGVDRKTAKTLNFGLLYGMGIAKLAEALKTNDTHAKELKSRYYSELRNVKQLSDMIMNVAKSRGYIRNKYGRRYYLNDHNFAYKMPNYLIQGTGAEVIRHCIPKIQYLLEGMKSNMLLQIHDELLFEIKIGEEHLVPEIMRIMESEYVPLNGMNLTCGCEFSMDSWKTTTFKPWSEYGY